MSEKFPQGGIPDGESVGDSVVDEDADDLAQLLDAVPTLAALRGSGDPIEPHIASQHVSAALAAVPARVGGGPSTGPATGGTVTPLRRVRAGRSAAIAALAVAGFVGGGSVLAAAGVLPESVRDVVGFVSIGDDSDAESGTEGDDGQIADEEPQNQTEEASGTGPSDADSTTDHAGEGTPGAAGPDDAGSGGSGTGGLGSGDLGSGGGGTAADDGAPASTPANGPAASSRHGGCVEFVDDCEPAFDSTPGKVTGGGTLADGRRLTLEVRSNGLETKGTVTFRAADGKTLRSIAVLALAVDGSRATVDGIFDDDGERVRFLLTVVDGRPDELSLVLGDEVTGGSVERGNLTVHHDEGEVGIDGEDTDPDSDVSNSPDDGDDASESDDNPGRGSSGRGVSHGRGNSSSAGL